VDLSGLSSGCDVVGGVDICHCGHCGWSWRQLKGRASVGWEVFDKRIVSRVQLLMGDV